ncbi:MAG: hypothetical protein ACRCUJ_08990 [Phocaeicola sp.]
MALGLLPILICMIGCIFLPESYVLYICSFITLGFFSYHSYTHQVRTSQLILFISTLSLAVCALIKLTRMEWLLPDNSIPITLELLVCCFSALFLFFPRAYKAISQTLYPKDSVLNRWACVSIITACGLHFLFSSLYELFYPTDFTNDFYTLFQLMPIAIIILSILFNFLTVITLGENTKKQVIVRIAPIFDGKVYLTPTNSLAEQPLLDLPINEFLSVRMKEINSCAEKLCEKYPEALPQDTLPRFSLKYISQTESRESIVLLYILPLKSSNDIHFESGHFVEPKEIVAHPHSYNPTLVEEAEHLKTTAEMWKLFG